MTKRTVSKFENSLFFLNSLNKGISFKIPERLMKFEIHVLEGHSEGRVSQIFYLGLRFYLMQSRKKSSKK